MIPALAFSDSRTPTVTDAVAAGENFAKAYRKLNEFSPVNSGRTLLAKTAYIKINELAISTVSANGLCFETESHRNCILGIPLVGSVDTHLDGIGYRYHAGSTCLFASSEKQRTVNTGGGVGIHFQIEKVSLTHNAMSGSYRAPLCLTKPQITSLHVAGVSFVELFKILFKQIDMLNGDPIILSKLALDDSFYRLCIGLICPELFLTDETRNGKRPYVRPELERLCEYISAHLTEAVTLTEMESVSGLSTRILQRSFQNTFGLTPKQWVRKQRLHAARRVMLNRSEPITITALAYDFCFASPSDFAHHYLFEFGEQPSHTLGRKNLSVAAKSSVDFGK